MIIWGATWIKENSRMSKLEHADNIRLQNNYKIVLFINTLSLAFLTNSNFRIFKALSCSNLL